MDSSRPLHPPHRCPSWRCPACLLPSLKQWPPPRSACCAPCRTSYCSGWSRARPAGGSPGTFSTRGQKIHLNSVWTQRIVGVFFFNHSDRCSYLCNPDEDFKLIDVELLIHTFSEPGPQQVHGGSVPLLKHINTTLSSKTHTHTHTQDIMT